MSSTLQERWWRSSEGGDCTSPSRPLVFLGFRKTAIKVPQETRSCELIALLSHIICLGLLLPNLARNMPLYKHLRRLSSGEDINPFRIFFRIRSLDTRGEYNFPSRKDYRRRLLITSNRFRLRSVFL